MYIYRVCSLTLICLYLTRCCSGFRRMECSLRAHGVHQPGPVQSTGRPALLSFLESRVMPFDAHVSVLIVMCHRMTLQPFFKRYGLGHSNSIWEEESKVTLSPSHPLTCALLTCALLMHRIRLRYFWCAPTDLVVSSSRSVSPSCPLLSDCSVLAGVPAARLRRPFASCRNPWWRHPRDD